MHISPKSIVVIVRGPSYETMPFFECKYNFTGIGEVESEPKTIYDGILRLLDTHIISSSTSDESKVFYLEMKDCYH